MISKWEGGFGEFSLTSCESEGKEHGVPVEINNCGHARKLDKLRCCHWGICRRVFDLLFVKCLFGALASALKLGPKRTNLFDK
jgi:hypothetical protein